MNFRILQRIQGRLWVRDEGPTLDHQGRDHAWLPKLAVIPTQDFSLPGRAPSTTVRTLNPRGLIPQTKSQIHRCFFFTKENNNDLNRWQSRCHFGRHCGNRHTNTNLFPPKTSQNTKQQLSLTISSQNTSTFSVRMFWSAHNAE